MKKKLFVAALIVVLSAAALIGFYTRSSITTDFVMGSILTQTWWGYNAADMALEDMQRLEQDLLNDTQAPPLALDIMEASNGAFNPFLGALTTLWNIDGDAPYIPTQDEIDEALQKKELDLGAYGKGAACDVATRNITFMPWNRPLGAVVNLGGNIATKGSKPWGKPFKIALRDPKGELNDILGMFALNGTNFISTSGSYEKYFERDGKRYHHIFDPETGYPAERDPGLISVTVITTGEYGGAIGDALSTACFVLGYEASQELLAKYHADAIFIYEDNTVKYAGSVEDYFRLENK